MTWNSEHKLLCCFFVFLELGKKKQNTSLAVIILHNLQWHYNWFSVFCNAYLWFISAVCIREYGYYSYIKKRKEKSPYCKLNFGAHPTLNMHQTCIHVYFDSFKGLFHPKNLSFVIICILSCISFWALM